MSMRLLVLNLLININKFITFRTRNLANIKEMILEMRSGNPILGFDKNWEILSAILVDGDTVYAYMSPYIHRWKLYVARLQWYS